MAVAAELLYERAPEQSPATKKEKYGLSLSLMRDVGRLSLQNAGSELEAGIDQLRGEYEATIFEGLKSDTEFGENLEVTSFDKWAVVDGHVMSADGKKTVVELIENGLAKSSHQALIDPRMETQARRDANDLTNALEVDAMATGKTTYNTRIITSAYPIEAMDRDGEAYWREIGYIKGLNYVQLYHAGDDGSVLTGSISFMSEPGKIREALKDFGVQIPETEATDNYINYAYTGTMTSEYAKDVAIKIRKLCEGEQIQQKINTVDILENNKDLVEHGLKEMLLPIAESLAQGRKNDKTKSIVYALLQNSSSYSSEVKQKLLRAYNSDFFDDDSTRLLKQLAYYSVIEGLRKNVKRTRAGNLQFVQTLGASHFQASTTDYHNMMANFAQNGAKAGRSYSGCGAQLKMSDDTSPDYGSLQEVFGGKGKEDEGECEFISKKCPQCNEKNVHTTVTKTHIVGKCGCSKKRQ